MNIDQAFRDPRLFGAAFDDLGSWQVWLTILCAAFALPLDAEQLQTFSAISGGRLPPARRVREVWCVAGRRSGKSRIAALIAVFLALFGNHRISYVQSDKAKSEIYRECIPLFTRGLVRLPEHPTLLRELRLLERVTHRGGKDSIDHPRGGHDDFANSLCGALRQLSDHLGYDTSYAWILGDGGIGSTDNLTDEQRAERRREEAQSYYKNRLVAYLGAHGAFGGPFGRMS